MPNPFESGLEADFTLETERGGLIEEPPFQILVTGDFSGDAVKKPLTDRRPKEIDRDNFEEVMSRIAPRLNLGDLVLDFAELDDFHPDQIFRHLPVFTELRDLRRRLKDESTYNKAAGDVRAWMMSGAPRDETPESTNGDAGGSADQQAADNLLDAILAKPEVARLERDQQPDRGRRPPAPRRRRRERAEKHARRGRRGDQFADARDPARAGVPGSGSRVARALFSGAPH
jgi:type VI secretion system ImpB/VipA family protein